MAPPAFNDTPPRIALLAALPREVRPFLTQVQARPVKGLGLPAWKFSVESKPFLAAVSGLGAAAARDAALKLAAAFPLRALISLGFGGGARPGLAPGDLVLGESIYLYDPETEELERVEANPCLLPLDTMLTLLKNGGLPAKIGALVTTPRILDKKGRLEALAALNTPVLDLETGAAARVAAESGLSFLGLRAITDTGDEEIPEFVARALNQGREPGPAQALRWLAQNPRRLFTLLYLRKRSRLAARRLAQALITVLPVME